MTSDFEMAPCEPSAVLQAQVFGGARWDCDTSGPRALMLAVLEDAVRCIEEGRWRSRFRVTKGKTLITRHEEKPGGNARSFCARCGTPLFYERARAPTMVNLPRALFTDRTGREPRYHMFIHEQADWTYLGEPLAPLKNYPGVMFERPRRKKRREVDPMFGD